MHSNLCNSGLEGAEVVEQVWSELLGLRVAVCFDGDAMPVCGKYGNGREEGALASQMTCSTSTMTSSQWSAGPIAVVAPTM